MKTRARVLVLLLAGPLLMAAKQADPDLVKQAEAGSREAQFVLGRAYATGKGAPKSNQLAVVWWTRAGEQGDTRAQINLARLYAEGKGVSKDDTEAVRWIFRAAKRGHPRAQFLIGERFMKGDGVAKNVVLAHMWLTLASSAGSGAAQFKLQSLDQSLTPAQRRASRRLAKTWAENRGSVVSKR